MGKARLQRIRGVYRGLESLAAFDHGYCIGWDVYDDEHILRNRSERRMDAEQQMVCVADQRRVGRRPRMDVRPRPILGQMASQRGRICNACCLWRADFSAGLGSRAR